MNKLQRYFKQVVDELFCGDDEKNLIKTGMATFVVAYQTELRNGDCKEFLEYIQELSEADFSIKQYTTLTMALNHLIAYYSDEPKLQCIYNALWTYFDSMIENKGFTDDEISYYYETTD